MSPLPSDLEQKIWKLYFRTYVGFLSIGTAFIGLLLWVPLPTGYTRIPALPLALLVLVTIQFTTLFLFPRQARQPWMGLALGNVAATLGILAETLMFGTQISITLLLWPMTLVAGFYTAPLLWVQGGLTLLSTGILSFAKAMQRPDPLWWVDALALAIPIIVMGSMLAFFRETALSKAALLAHQSGTDALTGLPNRRRLFEYLPDWRPIGDVNAVVMMDLDHFKLVNDRMGHKAGDDVLRAFAGLLGQHVRDSELGVRTGGEEFLWLLWAGTPAELLGRLEHFRETVARELQPYGVTVSLGVRFFEADSLDAKCFGHLMSEADDALYRAKDEGRNRLRIAEGRVT